MEAQAIAVEKPFAAAEEKFSELVTRLSAVESRRMTHSELESLIAAEGREIHRRLLQGHLDLRASEEQIQVSVRGADDVERTHHRRRSRGLLTVFGLVTAMRMTYGARRHGSLSPLDASLNLPKELHSHGLRRLAAIEAARGSFDATVEAIERNTGTRLIGIRPGARLRSAVPASVPHSAQRQGSFTGRVATSVRFLIAAHHFRVRRRERASEHFAPQVFAADDSLGNPAAARSRATGAMDFPRSVHRRVLMPRTVMRSHYWPPKPREATLFTEGPCKPMADAHQWQQLIESAASGRPAPLRAETFLKSWATASRPVLVRAAGTDYVIKGAQAGRMVVNDQIVGRLGMALGAPVGQVTLVEVPAELINIEPAMRHFRPGVSHASAFLGGCTERASFDHAAVRENRERFARLAVLYGWVAAQDHQFIYENAPPHFVHSVDHGHFFPRGPEWSSTTLAGHPGPQADASIMSNCSLTASDLREPARVLRAIINEVIASAVAAPPDEWAFDMTDRVALAMYLEQRRDAFAAALLSSQP